MKRYLLVFLLIFVISCSSSNDDKDSLKINQPMSDVNFEQLSLADALVKSAQQNKMVLLDFFSPT